jgi:hypothetical protein
LNTGLLLDWLWIVLYWCWIILIPVYIKTMLNWITFALSIATKRTITEQQLNCTCPTYPRSIVIFNKLLMLRFNAQCTLTDLCLHSRMSGCLLFISVYIKLWKLPSKAWWNEFYANQFMNTSTELLAGPTMKQVWKHITLTHFDIWKWNVRNTPMSNLSSKIL